MRVLVNGEDVDFSPAGEDDVEDVIRTLKQQELIEVGQGVISLGIDGKTWDAPDLQEPAETPLGDVGELAVETGTYEQLAQQSNVLQNLASLLAIVRQATQMVATKLREGPAEEANEHLYQLLHTLQQFVNCVYNLQNMCKFDRNPLEEEGETLDQVVDSLDVIEECQQEEEWGMLADRLDTVLRPALKRLEDLLQDLQREV
jgi:DNA repair ATPase RecN